MTEHLLEGGSLLAESLSRSKGVPLTPANLERLAAEVGLESARWGFQQWELRKRARAKFSLAESMLFDRDGLEMASHEQVAAYHAEQFPGGVLVADLTGGIGSDLIALARRGPALGLEIDPWRADLIRHNLRVHGLEAEVVVADCLQVEWDWKFAFVDPSRRQAGSRTRQPKQFAPDPEALSERFQSLERGLIKLSPLLRDDYLNRLGGLRTFLSFQGECREVLVEMGRQRRLDAPAIRAARIGSPNLVGGVEADWPQNEPGEWILEADPAAIRAHALGTLCRRLEATPLGDSNGYLTGSVLPDPDDGWTRRYRVCSFGRADVKRIREDLRGADARLSAVKVRGLAEDPRVWMAKLKAQGRHERVLILYPVGKSVRYALVESPGAA